jgi:hypothetical protein
LNYQVPPAAAGSTPIDLSGPASDGGFTFTYVDGSLSVGLEGDTNGDGRVGLRDLHALRQHFGMTAGATRADGDLDGDGDVDHGDLSRLVANYGRTNLAPPQAVIASESQLNRRASDAVLRGRRVSRPTPREAAVDSVLLDDAAFDSLAASARARRRQ